MKNANESEDLFSQTSTSGASPKPHANIDHITSIELEAQSGSVLKITAEKLFAGTHQGKIKLGIGKESVVLTREQAGALGVKLVRFSH